MYVIVNFVISMRSLMSVISSKLCCFSEVGEFCDFYDLCDFCDFTDLCDVGDL